MKMLMAATATILFTATTAYGAPCSCDAGADNAPETLIHAETARGERLSARFEADPVTRAVRSASLCTTAAIRVTEAKLWMPDMGHGSSPTRLTVASATCTTVERINFLMEGTWEIRVTLADGDTGTLDLEIQP